MTAVVTASQAPTIGDLVDVAPADAVVRLGGAAGRLAELVLTGDARDSLTAAMEAATGPSGGGQFLVGPFGSGKSHFLAALGELLDAARPSPPPAGWGADLREQAARVRRGLVVPIPLIEHRSEAALEDVAWARAWAALRQPSPTPRAGPDRVAAWARVQQAAGGGITLLVDELSEFLRAKHGAQLTEDLRFLQFLGEWASTHPMLVVAALQESLDEVANVSQRELARIRDRYPTSLGLSMRHVQDLVRGRLVRLRPGAERWVERAYREANAAFPRGAHRRRRGVRPDRPGPPVAGGATHLRCGGPHRRPPPPPHPRRPGRPDRRRGHALSRHVIPSLRHIPPDAPVVVLADHGFRESRTWTTGTEGRYTHGAASLEESVVPVATFIPTPNA